MKTSAKLLLAALPIALLAACGGGSDDNFDDRVGLADPKVRVVHAVPLAPNVTLYRNNVAIAPEVTDLSYKSASVYLQVSNSSDLWEVRTATTPALSVGTLNFNADRGHKYSFMAVPNAGSVTELVLIDDPFNKGLVSDNARVRVFNAAFNAASVDVYLTSPSVTDLSTVTPTFPAVGYKQALPASGADSTELEGGSYTLRLTTAGTKTVIFSAPVDLAKNADWLLTPVPGSVNPNDVKVLVARSDSGSPSTELSNTP